MTNDTNTSRAREAGAAPGEGGNTGVLDAAEQYAQALAQQVRAKERFTSYAARDKAIAKRKAKRAALESAIGTLRAQLEAAGRAIAEATVERGRAIARAESAEADATELKRDGFVMAPHYRGYANLGIGAYLLMHSHVDDPAEICIVPVTDDERLGREVGDLRDAGPGDIPAERMAVRLRFENVAGLDALEQQLRILREVHFDAARKQAAP